MIKKDKMNPKSDSDNQPNTEPKDCICFIEQHFLFPHVFLNLFWFLFRVSRGLKENGFDKTKNIAKANERRIILETQFYPCALQKII